MVFHKDTGNKYNPKGFNINGFHKDTNYTFDLKGFDIHGNHQYTKDKYDPKGLIEMVITKIPMINMILMVLIEMAIT